MQDKLHAALHPETRTERTYKAFLSDMNQTLMHLGLDSARSLETSHWIIDRLLQQKPLAHIETEIFEKLKTVIVDRETGCNLIDAIEPKLTGRAELIFSQLQAYFHGLAGKRILDFGAGDGSVTQMIYDRVSRHTVGIDVRAYGKVRVPILQYDGHTAPFPDASFDAIVSTNVLHHASDNQQCLNEFRRLLRPDGKMIVIETVPLGATEREAMGNMQLTFLNDYLYNRLLHHADVPVPGTFETIEGWVRRFEALAFSVDDVVDLGIDQQIIRDRHVILHVLGQAPIGILTS